MLKFLEKILNVRENEWGKLSLVLCINFCLGVGLILFQSPAEGLFLKEFQGVKYLPLVMVVSAILRVVVFNIYGTFVDVSRSDKVFSLLLFGTIIFALFMRLLVGDSLNIYIAITDPSLLIPLSFKIHIAIDYDIVYPTMRILYVVFNALLMQHILVYTSDIYNTLESKRLFPIVSTGGNIGGMISGWLLADLMSILPAADLLYGYCIFCGLSIILITITQKVYPIKREPFTEKRQSSKKKEVQSLENLKRGYKYVKESTILKVAALSSLSMIILMQIIEYLYSRTLTNQFADSNQLTAFMGRFHTISNAVALFVQILIIPRLIAWFGTGTVNMLYPSLLTASFLSILISPNGMGSAIMSRFARLDLRKSLKKSMDYLIYNAIPQNIRGRARAFDGGVVQPVGTAIASLLLFIVEKVNLPSRELSAISLIICAVYIYATFRLKKEYVNAFINLLKERNVDLKAVESGEVGKISSGELANLVKSLEDEDDDVSLFSAEVLARVRGSKVIQPLLNIIPNRSSRVKAGIIKILGDMKEPSVVKELVKYLVDPDSQVRSETIKSIRRIGVSGFENYIAAHFYDEDFTVRADAVATLLETKDNFKQQAENVLNEMLISDNPDLVSAGVYCLGQTNKKEYIQTLLPYLTVDSSKVRLSASHSLELLVDKTDKDVVNWAITGLDDPEKEVRFSSLRILKKIADPSSAKILIDTCLGNPSFKMRKLASEALIEIGKEAVPLLLDTIKSQNKNQLQKEFALITLGGMKVEGLSDTLLKLAESEIELAYIGIVRISALEKAENKRAVELLIKAIQDRVNQISNVTLKMLEIASNSSAMKLIQKSLKSKDKRLRADALETLENIGEKKIIDLLIPLFDDITNDARAEIAHKTLGIKRYNLNEAITQSLLSSDGWIKACAIFAAGEMRLKQFKSIIKKSIKDWDIYVKEAAVEALIKIEEVDKMDRVG